VAVLSGDTAVAGLVACVRIHQVAFLFNHFRELFSRVSSRRIYPAVRETALFWCPPEIGRFPGISENIPTVFSQLFGSRRRWFETILPG
jgi:hypothetical protein